LLNPAKSASGASGEHLPQILPIEREVGADGASRSIPCKREPAGLTIKLQEFVEIIGQILPAATIGNLNLPSGHIEHASLRNRNRRVGSVGLDLLCAFGSIDRELRHFKNPF
jgi:hypothetical protein